MERVLFFSLGVLVMNYFTTISAITTAVSKNNTGDLDSLLAFKAAIFDPDNKNIIPLNWSTSTPVCDWIGITCNTRHGRVAAIDLPNLGLVGTIPPQLGNLSFLVRLNLVNNSFHGELPMELAYLRRLKYIDLAGNGFNQGFPAWVGALSELQVLSLSNNGFSGPLSSVLANVTKLEILELSDNLLTGTIPKEYSALQKLKRLKIGFNQLSGTLPPALFNLSSLQEFILSNNSLSGYLPEGMCDHLPQLRSLALSMNEFHGRIPQGIGQCSGLEILSISKNNFSGQVPGGVTNLTALRQLFLGYTNIEGEIPKDINNLRNLEVLSAPNTYLTGSIPQEIGSLYNLEVIILFSNSFIGQIPESLFNMSKLGILDLTETSLSGDIPSTFGLHLPNLEKLYLGGNDFTGEILTSISNASRLSWISIVQNRFTGTIPDSLASLTFLKILSLSSNNFSYPSPSGELRFLNSLTNCRQLIQLWITDNPLNGFLPISIGNLSSTVKSIRLGYCGIKGHIPSSIGNLTNLTTLALNGNILKGTIPTSFGGLSELQDMNIGDNRIEGQIPSEFCQLSKLGRLTLSQNMLSGTVPSGIGNITSLKYLYLDSNNLSSNLPLSLWSLKDMLEIDLSVNSLAGSISFDIGNLKALTIMNLSMNQFFGEIPITIGTLKDLQTLSLEHNKLQGLIPESMKSMVALEHLDLSFNNLEGEIPKSLEELSHLDYFNVSYNRLRGPIPRGGPFMNFTNLSFISNGAFCGAPWLQHCPTLDHRSKGRVLLFTLLATGLIILASAIAILFIVRKLKRKNTAVVDDNFLRSTAYERVSIYELQQITNGFNESHLLGSGTFGSVYKGIRANGIIWAIKVFKLQLEGVFKSFDRECEVLRCLRHRNVTKVISACSNPDFKALVLEYMSNGSLENCLYSNNHFLDIKQRLDIMIDVACGLEYLHYGYSIPVVHCDLKPSNILLDEDMVGHVSDFGIAKLLGTEESFIQTETFATIGYIAPEYGSSGLVSTWCDVYSFGIILMETFTGRRPNDEMFTEEQSIRSWIQELIPDSVIQVIDANLLQLEDEFAIKKIACVSSVLQLSLSCTVDVPDERINIKDVLIALQKIKFQFLQSSNNSTSA